MRMIFGLVSLLVMIALVCLIFVKFEAPVIKQGQVTQTQARQISGHGQNGIAAIDSFKTDGKMRGRNLEGLVVTTVTPGGALDEYGLRVGDVIIEVNGAKVGDISVDDAETAKAMVVQTGYQANAPILVLRDGMPVTLPRKSNTFYVPSARPGSTGDAIKNQLDNLGLKTH